MTIHLRTADQIDAFADAISAQADEGKIVSLAEAAKAAELKRIIARKIKFHHMIEEGDRVFISYRRAAGVAEKLVIKTVNSRSFGKFLVRLEDGSITEENPEHLSKSTRQ